MQTHSAGINGSAWNAPWKSVNYLRVDYKELAPNRLNEEDLHISSIRDALSFLKKANYSIKFLTL